MASTDPVDEEARLRAVGDDEAAKFRVLLRDNIELQLESATAKLFNAESHIVKALWKKKFDELEADGEVNAIEVVEYLCKCDETNPPILGCIVHDDQGKLRYGSVVSEM
ncbi:hypothetical protein R1sor_016141 [Riccia sorocarpa]|uniref:Uncharacterized protein n=1 Tax=Riccia sorocarpa TaxID=122646 RepID=A0ABD3HHD1_9MARC